jgi:CRP/FNR family transcriptional regulator
VKPVKDLVQPPAPAISMRELRAHCMNCNVRELCLPVGVDQEAIRQIDSLVTERLRLQKGEPVYHAGDPFGALYAIRVGSCKTTLLVENGYQQVAGYHMTGDIIGLDGIGSGRHCGDAVALEDSELCVLPFNRIEELARQIGPLQRNLHRILSREIERDENVMLLLGSMRADERLAAFLLSLSERYHERGYSTTEFVLRLTREDIGSYLGLKLETISRLLSRFQSLGLIQVQGRVVKLLDLPSLRRLAGHRAD